MFKAISCTTNHLIVAIVRLTPTRAGGLPKKTETLYFFQIDHAKVREFRTQLGYFVPLITTSAEVLNEHRPKIAQSKKDATEKKTDPLVVNMCGVNIAFTQKGLRLVSCTIGLP